MVRGKKVTESTKYLVLQCVFDYLPTRTLARFQCINKDVKKAILHYAISKPDYADIIEQLQLHTYDLQSTIAFIMESTNGWGVRMSSINNGQRIRLDFRQSEEHPWIAFGKFQPKNLKYVLYRAIANDRIMNIDDTEYTIDGILQKLK